MPIISRAAENRTSVCSNHQNFQGIFVGINEAEIQKIGQF